MKLKPIKNDNELDKVLERINLHWEAKANTHERDELEVLLLLIESMKKSIILFHLPVEAIKSLMERPES